MTVALQYASLTEGPAFPAHPLPQSVEQSVLRQRAIAFLPRYPFVEALAVREPLETDMRHLAAWLQLRVEGEYGDAAFRSPTLREMIRRACRDVVTAHVTLLRTTRRG